MRDSHTGIGSSRELPRSVAFPLVSAPATPALQPADCSMSRVCMFPEWDGAVFTHHGFHAPRARTQDTRKQAKI